MAIKISPVIVSNTVGNNKSMLLQEIKKSNKNIEEPIFRTTTIFTDSGKETVNTLIMYGNNTYIDLDRILTILEINKEELISVIGHGAILMHDKKLYANSCNLIKVYNNINNDRAFFNSMLNLSTSISKKDEKDKLKSVYELLEAVKKIKSVFGSAADRETKSKLYENIRQDYLHDLENGNEGDNFVEELREISFKRRKSKNDLLSASALKDHIDENEINRLTVRLSRLIEINNNKIYNKKVKGCEIKINE